MSPSFPRDAQSFRVRAATVCAAIVTILCSGCSVLQSPYVLSPQARIFPHDDSVSYACDHTSPENVAQVPQSIETQFEAALKQHATFSSLFGEALIPLAAVIGYRATYKAGKNPKALMAGGLAAYGVGSYLYKKPQEDIYLTGISALECAQRLADAQRLNEIDESALQAIAGLNLSGKAESEYHFAKQLYDDAQHAVQESVKRHSENEAALTQWRRCSKSNPDEAQDRILLRAQSARLQELQSRLDAAQAVARNVLAANDSVDLKMCRVSNQIRDDVNHMLVAQSADPDKMASLLSTLKFPAPQPTISSTNLVPAAPGGGGTDLVPAGMQAFVEGEVTSSLSDCRPSSISARVSAAQKRLEIQLGTNQANVEKIERRITQVRPDGFDEAAVLAQCGVQTVAKPTPLTIAAIGPVEIVQGSPERNIGLSGGRPYPTSPPYHAILATAPASGSLGVSVTGSPVLGYNLTVKADGEATTADYTVVVTDADGSTPTVTIRILPKKQGTGK